MFTIVCLLTTLFAGAIVLKLGDRLDCRFTEFAFFAGYGLIFGLAPWMQSPKSYVNEFGATARTEAAWYALAGLAALVAGFALTRKPHVAVLRSKRELMQKLSEPRGQRLLKNVFWTGMAVAAAAQLLMMHAKGVTIVDLLYNGRFAFRFDNQGVLTVMSTHLTSCVYVPAFVGVFLNRRYQWFTLIYMAIASLLFFFIFSKGTRSVPLAMLVTYLVATSLRYRVSAGRALAMGSIGGVALMLAIGLYELRRQQDSSDLLSGATALLSPETYEGVWDRDPLGYSANLVGAVATFPHVYPYLDAATYRRMLVFYLQESAYPDLKPPDTNIQFGLMVHGRQEDLQVTVPPSILGDVWINFWGWWGLPFLALHGALYGWMLQKMQTSLFHFLWVGPLSGRFLVLVHRGEPYEMFVLFLLFMLQMTGILMFSRWASAPSTHVSTRHARHVSGLPAGS